MGPGQEPVESLQLPMDADLGPLKLILSLCDEPLPSSAHDGSPPSDIVVELAERVVQFPNEGGGEGCGELFLYAKAPSASLFCPICLQVLNQPHSIKADHAGALSSSRNQPHVAPSSRQVGSGGHPLNEVFRKPGSADL